MGIKKISSVDRKIIINVLRHWPITTSLSWEDLRKNLCIYMDLELNHIWSRQSLSSNREIYPAFVSAKKRLELSRKNRIVKNKSTEKYEEEIERLNIQLFKTNEKYDALLIRHTQLVYNTSLVDNGNHLLDDPLPDNTRAQKG